jgi:hypothetical protein
MHILCAELGDLKRKSIIEQFNYEKEILKFIECNLRGTGYNCEDSRNFVSKN